ncbi:hypothetical protein [Neolewinella persica]|uniref:hypothetical protein n=1 Tax=Neolewinella persica TaxID=70998 RepID=UPI00036DD0CF|nr:hypothetical protein [Neolewinella persica]
MRLLLLFLLLPCFLTAQTGKEYPDRYVWAKSGLTMRNTGNTGGEKIMVVPFGAKVSPTGKVGQQANVTALPAVSYRQEGQSLNSDAYLMQESYLEVTYQDKTGYLYNGYLSEYSPTVEAGSPTDYIAWMTTQFGEPANTSGKKLPWQHEGRQRVSHYPTGVMVTNSEYEGGGSMTLVFPSGSINDGYLIAARFFGVTEAVDRKKEFDEGPDLLPELLKVQDDGTLRFTGDMSETVIQIIGSMLIIHSSGGC